MAKKKQKLKQLTSKQPAATPTLSKKKTNKKEKPQKTDGFGPLEKANVRKAIRLVWTRSHSKQLVVKRCTRDDGFLYCEKCNLMTPKIEVNHKITVGDVDDGFLSRLFVPSTEMEGLCKKCHAPITNAERKAKTKKAPVVEESDVRVTLDSDIAEMDLYTKDKMNLQRERNASKKDSWNLDDYIGASSTPTTYNDLI